MADVTIAIYSGETSVLPCPMDVSIISSVAASSSMGNDGLEYSKLKLRFELNPNSSAVFIRLEAPKSIPTVEKYVLQDLAKAFVISSLP
jgi:hypothetical protein